MSDASTMGAATTPGVLTAQFVNYGSDASGVANVVYIATDTTTNRIDLELQLTSGSSTLVPGDVVDLSELPPSGSQSLFYLDLSALQLTTAEWATLAPTADGFHCQVFASDQVVGFAPSSASVVLGTTAVAIHLAGLELASAPPSPPGLSVTYYNVPGVTSSDVSLSANFGVVVQQPPSGKADLTEVLNVGVVSASVVNSRGAKQTLQNALTLQISRKKPNVAVPAGPDTVFTFSFVYGATDDRDGYGALTDVPEAKLMKLNKGDNVDQWKRTPYLQAESPYWTVQPPAGEALAGTGVTAVRSWSLTKIATTYQPGATLMQVQYTGVPGYEDGVFTIVLDKIPHALVTSLTVSPNPAVLNAHGQAKVTVSWVADYATKLTLTQNYAPVDVTGKSSVPAVLTAQSTHLTLTAEGPGADVDNSDFGNATAFALPVINAFQGGPTQIYTGTGKHDVALRWAAQTSGKVAISGSTGQDYGDGFPAVGTSSVPIRAAQMLTLSPVADPGVTAPSRNLVVGGFSPLISNPTLSTAAVAAAASPSGPFVACVTAAGQVIALDTVQFSPIPGAVATAGASPTGLVFSPDGSLLVVLNGDGTASLISVALSAGLPTFSPLQTLALGGNPQSVVVTPDRSTLYFSIDGTPGSLVAATRSGSQYAAGTPVPLGNGPRGLAMLPSGAQIFVANSVDDTISVVGVGVDGGLQPLTPIQLSTTGKPAGIQPTGLAVTADGGTLLAACPGTGVVWALQSSRPNGGTRQQVTVGAKPTSVSVTPSGAYAFVANSGDGTLSLLDVWGGPGQCAVEGGPLKTAIAPHGVSVSPDGLTAIAADPATAKLAVVTLAIYDQAAVATDVGPSPSNVVVTGDGKAAVVWLNALSIGPHQVPGVRYYALASGVSTGLLADIAPVACAFPAGSTTLHAIGNAGGTLYVVDLSDPRNPDEQELDLGVQATTVGLAVAATGGRVLVVTASGGQYTLLVGTVSGGTWSTTQSLPLYTGSQPGPVTVATTPDGSTIFVADAQNQRFVTLSKGARGAYAVAGTQLQIPRPISVVVSPDGATAWVLSATTPDTITVVDVATLTSTAVSALQPYVNLRGLVLSPDGRYLFGADLSAGALRILDPRSLRILQTLALAPSIAQAQGASGVAISPDASHVFVVNKTSGTLSVLAQYPI